MIKVWISWTMLFHDQQQQIMQEHFLFDIYSEQVE